MNRRRNERYVVVDNLLYELYMLKPDTIQYQVIHGQPYLVNVKKIRQAEIGFRVRMNEILDERVPSGTKLNKINEILNSEIRTHYVWDEKHKCEVEEIDYSLYIDYEQELREKYEKYLCLSNVEKYILNILIDKYLDDRGSTISLKDMETNYRCMAMNRRNISLNNESYRRYILTIDALRNKELYLKTGSTFRKDCYGSNNLIIKQKLLTLHEYEFSSGNKFKFNFSLGSFGKVLKHGKRFCTIPSEYFKVQFKQVKKNLIAQYIARKIYIEKLYIRRCVTVKSSSDINYVELYEFIAEPFKQIKSNYSRYSYDVDKLVCKFLKNMKEEKQIWDFEFYDKTIEPYWQKGKTDEDLKREEWFKELDKFQCEKKDRISNHDMTISRTIIYYIEPSIKEQQEMLLREIEQTHV